MNGKIILSSIGVVIVGLGVALGVTNPGPDEYVDFAVAQGTEYLETEACTLELPLFSGPFQDRCLELVQSEAAQDRIRKAMIEKTERQNYLLFSVYRTELAIQDIVPFIPGNFVPTYYVESVGILKTFRVYKTEET